MPTRRAISVIASTILVTLLAVHHVPDHATAEDRDYGERILSAAGYENERRDFGDMTVFENQIRAISAVQDAVIRMAERDEEIPFNRPREPRDAFEQKKGLCYDRSRAIEKILDALGLQTRHVAVYATVDRGALLAVLTPGNDSHALTEVLTARGWMAVDPNVRWIGLTADGSTLSVESLRTHPIEANRWANADSPPPHPIFSQPYVFVRGLYSRHGRFYAPYTPFPDVNWRQLLDNFLA